MPLLPELTIRLTLPLAPDVAVPVRTATEPLLPLELIPVLRVREPLTPPVPPAAVANVKAPLLVVAP